jgi:hypothetical protein
LLNPEKELDMAKSVLRVGQTVWVVTGDHPDAKAEVCGVNMHHKTVIVSILPEYREDGDIDGLAECAIDDIFTLNEYAKRSQNG